MIKRLLFLCCYCFSLCCQYCIISSSHPCSCLFSFFSSSSSCSSSSTSSPSFPLQTVNLNLTTHPIIQLYAVPLKPAKKRYHNLIFPVGVLAPFPWRISRRVGERTANHRHVEVLHSPAVVPGDISRGYQRKRMI